jgi:uncharacterized protein YjdB
VFDAKDAVLANVPLSWSTSNPSVATVDPNGVVRAVGQGLAIITATGGGVSGTSPVHVTSAALDVQPSLAEALAGTTLQLSAAGPLGPVVWATSDASIATVSPTGIVTAESPGRVVISATSVSAFGTQRGTATIDVTAEPDSIGASAVVNAGGTLRFSSTAHNATRADFGASDFVPARARATASTTRPLRN